MNLSKPVTSKIIQLFGEPSAESKRMGYVAHTGIDFQAKIQEVKAAHDGEMRIENTVAYILSKSTNIKGIPCRIETAYAHLAEIEEKTEVKAGEVIGKTSRNKGLHFSLTVYWLKNGKYVAHKDNGYNGRVDPLPYFEREVEYVYAKIILLITMLTFIVYQTRLDEKIKIILNNF